LSIADSPPNALSATQALALIREGRLTVEGLAQACLDRVAEREPSLRAWSHIQADLVLSRARELDGVEVRGPLHGLPIAVKDVFLTEDMPTQYNSPIYNGFHPRTDAAVVKILRAAGALIFGKTETVAFAATGRKAPTRNPRNLAHSPGGSSSGSAAAVADFHTPLALGTQTGGSIVRPASYCGVFGMKPTWNLISNEGAKTFATSLDTVGWFARTAADLELLYDVLDPEPPTPAAPFELRRSSVAVCRTPMWSQAEPATRDALMLAAERLRSAGASVEDLDLPSPFEDLHQRHFIVMRAEGRAAFLAEYRADYALLEPDLRDYVENRWGYARGDLRQAYDVAADCRARFDALAEPYDLILAPSAVGEAPLGLSLTGEMTFNGMWTLLHAPCINVPGFSGPLGLPVGVTVVAPRFADRRALAAAKALDELFGAASSID
jgi:Asp-tRNA(Asn)/Glu-tRNA(Gln) amidotransferase A subunit family amidase